VLDAINKQDKDKQQYNTLQAAAIGQSNQAGGQMSAFIVIDLARHGAIRYNPSLHNVSNNAMGLL